MGDDKHNFCQTRIDLPYPEIKVAGCNPEYALAMLSNLMGVDPRLWTMENRQMVYWTPGYNQYPYEVREVICNSIRGEEGAIRKYRKQAETIGDPNIVAILERIILDEERHVEIFYKMLDMVD